MRDLIRKSILFGLGGYSYVRSGIKDYVKELEKDGKLTPEEGRKLVDEFMNKAKLEAKKLPVDDMKKMMQRVVSEMGFATKDDIRKLRKELLRKKSK